MYLATTTRPDIAHAVSVLSQFNDYHNEEHWLAAKRVLRYLKGTKDVGLVFGASEDLLTGYADADYANDVTDRKSYTGYVFSLGGTAISWSLESKDPLPRPLRRQNISQYPRLPKNQYI